MVAINESAVHRGLVAELLEWFRTEKGFRIFGADLPGYRLPDVVSNTSGMGDGGDKRPDIFAYDETSGVYVRGEAKTGEGDLETEHTATQLQLFARLEHKETKKPSVVYLLVPASKVAAMQATLKWVGLYGKSNVISLRSDLFI